MDTDRMKRYREDLAFCEGTQWLGTARRRERRLVFNYTRSVVEKTASFTVAGVRFVADPRDSGDDGGERGRRLEDALEVVSEENGLGALELDSDIDACVLGDGAWRVSWDVAEKRVRVTAPDVQGLYVWSLPDDLSRFWRLAQRYDVSEEYAAMLVGPRDTSRSGPFPPARSGQRRVVEVWTDETFELFLDGVLVEAKPNPYGFIPYVVYPNVRVPKRFWGASDVSAVRESQRELNRALSQLSTILELSGNPIAVLENVTESADISVAPGSVWELPEKAKAYLLDLLQGGGVRLHVDYVDLLYRALHDLGEVPRVAWGAETASTASGVALSMQLGPLLRKVTRKRMVREVAFRRRNEMVLRLLTQFTGVDYAPFRTRTVWSEVLPPDRAGLVVEEKALVGAGIHSRRRAATQLGVEDAAAEFEQWFAEQERIGGLGNGGTGDGGGGGAADNAGGGGGAAD